MSSFCRAVAKTTQNFQISRIQWKLHDHFLRVTQKDSKNLIFGGLASLRHYTEPPRVILTVLWAYNNDIQLHIIPFIWRKINN